MNMSFRSLRRLIILRFKGLKFKILHPNINIGKRLKLSGSIRISKMYRNSKLNIGNGVHFYQNVGFFLDSPTAVIEIGDYTYINRRTEILSKESIKIGSKCAISWDVTIMDSDFHQIGESINTKPIEIGNHVLIGCKATILKGVKIGDGAIIASGALVTSDVPPKAMVAGSPAKIIKQNVDWK